MFRHKHMHKPLGTAMRHEGMTPIVGCLFVLCANAFGTCRPTGDVIWRETVSAGFTLVATLLPGVLAWSLTLITATIAGISRTAPAASSPSCDTFVILISIGFAVWYLVRRLRADLGGESPCASCRGTSCRVVRSDGEKT